MLMLLACTCSIEFRSMGKQRTKHAFAIPLSIECVVSSALVQLTRVLGGCVQSCNFTIRHAPVGTHRSQPCTHTHTHNHSHWGCSHGHAKPISKWFETGLVRSHWKQFSTNWFRPNSLHDVNWKRFGFSAKAEWKSITIRQPLRQPGWMLKRHDDS